MEQKHLHAHDLVTCRIARQIRYTAREFCCHGCGDALTVVVDESPDYAVLNATEDRIVAFLKKHDRCGRRVSLLAPFCPAKRKRITVLDLRKRAKRK